MTATTNNVGRHDSIRLAPHRQSKTQLWERNARATARSCVKKGMFSSAEICMRVTKVSTVGGDK